MEKTMYAVEMKDENNNYFYGDGFVTIHELKEEVVAQRNKRNWKIIRFWSYQEKI